MASFLSTHSSGKPLSTAMAAKFVVVLALVAAGQCSVVPVAKVDTDYSSFAYDVADPNTGDYKSQVETRSGGNVAGQYSLLDSDGTKRTVDYTADDVHGFNAVVRKDPVTFAAPVVSAPVVAAAPVVETAPAVVAARIAAPVYTAPIVKTVSSPVYAASAPVYAARSYAPTVYTAPSVYSAGLYAPSVYSSIPSVYGRTLAYGSPLTYSAYSAPLSYW